MKCGSPWIGWLARKYHNIIFAICVWMWDCDLRCVLYFFSFLTECLFGWLWVIKWSMRVMCLSWRFFGRSSGFQWRRRIKWWWKAWMIGGLKHGANKKCASRARSARKEENKKLAATLTDSLTDWLTDWLAVWPTHRVVLIQNNSGASSIYWIHYRASTLQFSNSPIPKYHSPFLCIPTYQYQIIHPEK